MAMVKMEGMEGVAELHDMLKDMHDKDPKAFRKGCQDFMVQVFQMSQQQVPVDNGVLRESGHLDIDSTSMEISYTAPYAAAVHWGYIRHLVKPVRRKALRWEVGRVARLSRHGSRKSAQWAFSKGHYVPKNRARTEPQPYLTGPFIRALQTGLLERAIFKRMAQEGGKA